MPRVHRGVQHPWARLDQVEGEAVRGAGQDLDQAGGQVEQETMRQEIMKCFRGVGLILFAEIVWMRWDTLARLVNAGSLTRRWPKCNCLCFSFDVWSVAVVFSQNFCKNGLNFFLQEYFDQFLFWRAIFSGRAGSVLNAHGQHDEWMSSTSPCHISLFLGCWNVIV